MQTDRTEGLRTFTLTIKGEPFEADRALSDRDFGGDHVSDLGNEQVVRITCRADDVTSVIRRLNEWFNEPDENGLRYTPPFPVGTLLYWAPDDREPMNTYRRMQVSGEPWS